MTRNTDKEIKSLFKDKEEHIRKHGIRIYPDQCIIVKKTAGKVYHARVKSSRISFLMKSSNYPIGIFCVCIRKKLLSAALMVSEFNHFSAFVDDVHCSWPVQRVVMDKNFVAEDLDIKYRELANEE